MADLKMVFIRNLKEARKRKNFTQAQLAEKTDLSVGFIGDIETGRTNPSFQTIETLSQALGVEPYELFIPPEKGKNLEQKKLTNVLDEVREVLEKYIVSE